MSFLKCKDIDLYLSNFLNDETLKRMCHLNRYYYHLYDDAFFTRRFKYQYSKDSKYLENITKKQYFENQKYLRLDKISESILFALEKDRVGLLSLIFSLKYEGDFTYYIDERHFFRPITIAIEHDSIKCYIYLFQFYKHTYNEHLIKTSIKQKSVKILKYIFDTQFYKKYINACVIWCLIYFSSYLLEIFIVNNIYIDNDEIFNILCRYEKSELWVSDWVNEYNPSCDLFWARINEDKIRKYKNKALETNNFLIIKLIDNYTSKFSKVNIS